MFVSEYTAMKQAFEYVRGLRYKLQMIDIPCGEPMFGYGDSDFVRVGSTVPALKKNMNTFFLSFYL
jgi:hypothetical protein